MIKDLGGAHLRRRAVIQCHMLTQYQQLDDKHKKVIDYFIEGLQNKTLEPTLDLENLLARYEEEKISSSTIQGKI